MNAVKKFLQPKTRWFVILGFFAFAVAMTMYVTLAFATGGEVSILDGNNAILVSTSEKNVQTILNEAGILLKPHDIVSPAVTEEVPENGQIIITRVEYVETVEEEAIPYGKEEVQSAALVIGTREVTQAGADGAVAVTYKVKKVNGVETEREELMRETVREPQSEITSIGTKLTAAGLEAMGARSIVCTATAYDGSYATLGYYNPKTALGETPTVGTVAVDPKVIPLGTKLYIETTDGSYIYGESFAGDTGGSIKGNRVDLFMASRAQALSFGRRQVKVYIIE